MPSCQRYTQSNKRCGRPVSGKRKYCWQHGGANKTICRKLDQGSQITCRDPDNIDQWYPCDKGDTGRNTTKYDCNSRGSNPWEGYTEYDCNLTQFGPVTYSCKKPKSSPDYDLQLKEKCYHEVGMVSHLDEKLRKIFSPTGKGICGLLVHWLYNSIRSDGEFEKGSWIKKFESWANPTNISAKIMQRTFLKVIIEILNDAGKLSNYNTWVKKLNDPSNDNLKLKAEIDELLKTNGMLKEHLECLSKDYYCDSQIISDRLQRAIYYRQRENLTSSLPLNSFKAKECGGGGACQLVSIIHNKYWLEKGDQSLDLSVGFHIAETEYYTYIKDEMTKLVDDPKLTYDKLANIFGDNFGRMVDYYRDQGLTPKGALETYLVESHGANNVKNFNDYFAKLETSISGKGYLFTTVIEAPLLAEYVKRPIKIYEVNEEYYIPGSKNKIGRFNSLGDYMPRNKKNWFKEPIRILYIGDNERGHYKSLFIQPNYRDLVEYFEKHGNKLSLSATNASMLAKAEIPTE